MADGDTGQGVQNDPGYVRRLDRSPEKVNSLPAEDRKLVYTLRSAIQGTHSKMQLLRDEVDQRDREIDKEKSLRKSLEEKLEKSRLVEMYGSPDINDELHDRLPRSHHDRKYRRGDGRHHSDTEVEERIEQSVRKDVHSSRRHDSEGSVTDSVSRKDSRHRGSKSHHRSKHARSRSAQDSYSDDSYHSASHRSRHIPYPHYALPYGAYPPPALPPHMSFASPPGAGYMTAYPYTPPQHTGFMPQPFAPPTATSTPTRPVQQQRPFPEAGQNVENVSPLLAADQSASVAMTTTQTNNAAGQQNGHTSGQVNGSIKNNTVGGQVLSEISNIASNESVLGKKDRAYSPSVDQSRQIAALLRELDAAKDLNKKLSDRLYETEKEMEALKLQQKTRAAEIDERVAGKAGDLVEQIYKAQKERDAAVMGRLRLANEERDEAVTRLERLQRGLDESDEASELPEEDGQSEVSGMLSKINESQSSSRIKKQGKKLVDQVHKLKGRKQEITAEEMQAILEERDAVLAKAKHLEQELLKVKKLGSTFSPNKEQEKVLKAKLLATQQERDMALAKVRRLSDELQNLQVYYSLHKSLSQEASLRDQFNNSLENLEEQLKERDGYVSLAQKENNKLLAQLKTVIDEKAVCQQEMEKARNGQREANANCEKLERLVSVLRRKVNGLGSKADE